MDVGGDFLGVRARRRYALATATSYVGLASGLAVFRGGYSRGCGSRDGRGYQKGVDQGGFALLAN